MNISPEIPTLVRTPCCGRYAFADDHPDLCDKCGKQPYMEPNRSIRIFYDNWPLILSGKNPIYPPLK